jgi:hypothetical protein
MERLIAAHTGALRFGRKEGVEDLIRLFGWQSYARVAEKQPLRRQDGSPPNHRRMSSASGLPVSSAWPRLAKEIAASAFQWLRPESPLNYGCCSPLSIAEGNMSFGWMNQGFGWMTQGFDTANASP